MKSKNKKYNKKKKYIGEAKSQVDGLIDPTNPSGELKIIKPKNPGQSAFLASMLSNIVTVADGPAGCGKSILSAYVALSLLYNNKVSKIIITRPVVEAGESIGFLPGNLEEKLDPYLRPIYSCMEFLIGRTALKGLIADKTIEVVPFAFMRGLSFMDSFVILDEGQNTTPEQMKMFLTRLGSGTKMVISGDTSQVDLGPSKISGLSLLIDRIPKTYNPIPNIGVVKFADSDIVRHPLIAPMLNLFY